MGPGHVIADRFVIESLVGEGGMGSVYRARDRLSQEPVAVKLVSHAEGFERFQREASVLAGLKHPRIVRYVTQGVLPEGAPFLVMEWLEGEDLGARLTRGPLSLDETFDLALGVADVLSVTHRQGIVHRDIKPHNLFLPKGDAASVKVLDFGIARAQQHARLTGTGVLLGTPAYMAPEQARAEGRLDARVDVFALGCVIFECLAGHPAFSGDHAVAVLAKILLEDAPRLSDVRADVPARLSLLVERMLAKDRELRPADGNALALELAASRADSSSAPRVASLGRSERRMVSLAISATAGTFDETIRPDERSFLERRAIALTAARGGKLQLLANGSMVATVESGASPTDQAACAARVALALAGVLGTTPVALCTGYAVSGERVPTGEAIDRAVARLTAGASGLPAGVRIDRATASLLDRRFVVTREGDELFLSAEADVVEATRTLLGRPTTFVGRDRELASLVATLDECAGDSVARVALITAPAGFGKSRLCHELVRVAKSQHDDLEILFARGDPLGAGAAFGLAGQLLRRAAGVVDAAPHAEKAEQLWGRISRHLPESARSHVAELLLEIADAPLAHEKASEALRAARRDASIMSDAVRMAWDEWLDAECSAHPVLIVMEDLHWGDLPSVRLIDSALKGSSERPLMVLASGRPEVHTQFSGLWAERQLSELRLGPVAKRAAERFVRDALPNRADDGTVAFVVERAAGHPFYLEELVRALAEGRRRDELPESVLGMVQSRLDNLGAEMKRALRAASVFGNTFWSGGVAVLLAAEEPKLGVLLEELVQKELLERRSSSSIPNQRELAFRHAVIRDAAYEMLTDSDRALGHRLAAEWLERAGGQEPSVLAEHFDRAGMLDHAGSHYRRAAEHALEGNDVERAINLGERAIACGASGTDHAALLLLLAEAEFWRGALGKSAELATAAAEKLREASRGWYEAVAQAVVASGQRGDNARVAEWLERVIATQAEPDAVNAQVFCLCRGASQLCYAGMRDTALRALDLVRELAPEPAQLEPVASAWFARVRGEADLFFHSDLMAPVAGFAQAAQSFELAGAHRNACLCRLMQASAMYLSGADDAETSRVVARGQADAARLGVRFVEHFAWDIVALWHCVSGRFDQAIEAARRCLSIMRGTDRIEIAMYMVLSLCQSGLGRWTEAEAEARRAVELARKSSLRGSALAMLAHAVIAQGRVDEGLALAEEAILLQPETRGPSQLDGSEGWAMAEALAAAGRHAEARKVAAESLARVAVLARSIPDPERRERYWQRRMGIYELVRVAEQLGLEIPRD